MPIVRLYPVGEASPHPLPDVAPNVPAAGDIDLFGGNRARDLQLAGQQLGQASDSLAALHERTAREANDTRVQDLNNRFMDRSRAILRTGPDAYYTLSGADAIAGADAASTKLASLKDETFGQAANGYQRRRLGPILDAHLAASAIGITGHAVAQHDVYSRGVAARAIETSRATAIADPEMMDSTVFRAEGAARALHAGQPTEAVETGVRAAGGSVIAGVIGDRLARNDPMGVALFRQYSERLDDRTRRTLGAAAETLSNSIEATAWLRDRSATLRTPAPTGDAALDAVNAASASTAEPLPVVSSGGALLDQDGIVGTRERLAEIENRGRALTALNQQEFAAHPARLRANQTAIDTDTARNRAAVKTETDTLYADLRRHLTTGGPNGGPAVMPPSATIMSRLTDAQQDAVAGQVNAAIEGRKPSTDPQTWYAIRQGLIGADANDRQRWASKNLVQFMGRLSAEDLAALEKLQASMRINDGGAEQNRLQIITRMADQALQTVGIDPTPRPGASPDSDAAQAAMFHRVLEDELSAFESGGRKPTEAEAYDIVNGLKETGIKSGWLKVSDVSPTVSSDIDDAFGGDGASLPQAEPPGEPQRMRVGIDFDRLRRMREESEQATVGIGGSNGAPAIEPDPGSPEYRAADAQARRVVAGQDENISAAERAETVRSSVPRDASVAVPGVPALAPAGAILGEIGQAALEAARKGASLLVRAAPVAAGVAAAAPIILLPGNSGAELHPMSENLRVRTAPGQRSATVQRRVDDGLFGTGVGEKWVDLPVEAEWASDERTGRRYIAIDRRGLEGAIGRDAADAVLGEDGSAMVRPPSKGGGRRRSEDDEESEWGDEPRQESSRPRDRRQDRPPPASDLEQRPDRAPSKPPHELSDDEIADIAHKIVSGHASDKHRIEQKEFPELGSDPELEAHVADVIKKARSPASDDPADEQKTEWKRLPDGRTAYRHKDSGTIVVDDPLGEGTVLRSEDSKRYFDDLDKMKKIRRR